MERQINDMRWAKIDDMAIKDDSEDAVKLSAPG